MALFESYERRIDKILSVLNNYGIKDIEEAIEDESKYPSLVEGEIKRAFQSLLYI